jgi:hypothetical protein
MFLSEKVPTSLDHLMEEEASSRKLLCGTDLVSSTIGRGEQLMEKEEVLYCLVTNSQILLGSSHTGLHLNIKEAQDKLDWEMDSAKDQLREAHLRQQLLEPTKKEVNQQIYE